MKIKSHTSIACGILAGTVLTGIGLILTGWPAEADSPIEVKEVAVANNKFAFELYARLAKEPGNLVLSPFSAGAAFAMTSAGARGETARQMAKTLHFSSWPSDVHTRFASLLKELNDTNASRCRLVIANSLWRQKGFPVNHLFHEIVRDQYGGYLGEVDFRTFADAARQQINGWVATQTQGKIKDMIESGLVHSETDLVLGNAVYFEGRWSIPFDKDSTKLTLFHLSPGESVPVPMMNALRMLEIPALAPAVAALGVLLIGGQSKRQMNPNRIDETAEHAEYAKGKSRDSFTLRVKRTATLNAASHALFSRGPRISRFTPIASSRFKDILAGVLFGVAFQIKLVNVILLPLAALIVWVRQHERAFSHCPDRPTPDPSQEGNSSSATSRRLPPAGGAGCGLMNKTAQARSSRDGVALFRSLLFLAVSLAISFVAIDYLIDRGAFLLLFRQSWSSHFTATKSFEYGSPNDHPFDWSIFLKNWDTTVPALVGIGLLLWAKLPALCSRDRMSLVSPSLRLSPPPSAGERVAGRPATGPSGSVGKTVVAVVPFAWLTLTLIVLATHKPWWSYYYIHIAIPLCWCAAIGVEAAWHWIHWRPHLSLSLLLGVFAVCAAGWMGLRVYLQISGKQIASTSETFREIQSDLRGGHCLECGAPELPGLLAEDKRVSGEFHRHRCRKRLEFFHESAIRVEWREKLKLNPRRNRIVIVPFANATATF